MPIAIALWKIHNTHTHTHTNGKNWGITLPVSKYPSKNYPIIQFSKEVSHITDEWVRLHYVFNFSLPSFEKNQSTFILELHFLVNYNHNLATDIRA